MLSVSCPVHRPTPGALGHRSSYATPLCTSGHFGAGRLRKMPSRVAVGGARRDQPPEVPSLEVLSVEVPSAAAVMSSRPIHCSASALPTASLVQHTSKVPSRTNTVGALRLRLEQHLLQHHLQVGVQPRFSALEGLLQGAVQPLQTRLVVRARHQVHRIASFYPGWATSLGSMTNA